MGSGMAKNLLLAEVDLFLYDLRQEISNEYVQLGARVAKSSAILATRAKIIFLCLPFTPEVDVVLFGQNGVAEGAEKGSMIINTSTIYVSEVQAF